MNKLTENILDKFSLEYIKNQVLKNAYANDDTKISKLDPRILFVWYLFFGIVPWFLHDVKLLMSMFVFVIITTKLAKIAPLVLFVFCLGILSQSGYMLIFAFIFGGNVDTIFPLLVLSLKVATVSLASITVFSGLDPDRLASGLLWFGFPDKLAFSISFAYRVLPMLMEEFQNILLSYRLRGKGPDKKDFIGKIRNIIYQIKIIILAFYPFMLNTAKRSRTTVEALELKGYRQSLNNPAIKKMKMKMLRVKRNDVVFLAISVLWIGISVIGNSLI